MTSHSARARVPKSESPAAHTTSRKPRLQLEFTQEAYDRLQELKELSGSHTNAEVIRKALHVFDWLLMKRRDDFNVQLVKGDTTREVELVGLLR